MWGLCLKQLLLFYLRRLYSDAYFEKFKLLKTWAIILWSSLYKIKRTEKIIVVIKNKEIGLDLLLDLLLANVGGA